MEYSKFELPRPNLKGLVLSICLGVVVALALYQAQVRGWIPSYQINLPKPSLLETRTIVQEENAVISVVEKTSPSVVAIGITRRVINPFDPFSVPTREDSTIGTGFVVDKRGIIVTNKHVVSESGNYSVITRDNQKYEVRKIYRDPVLDMAIVEIEGAELPAIEMGDSSKLKVGQTLIAIGNALGRFTNTVTTGVVSGLGRKVTTGDPFSGYAESLDNLIQTDAAINPGNSGGPLLNSAGYVIGVNVATTSGAQNIGFAIPINAVKQVVDEFILTGTVSRPYLGIRYRFISEDMAVLSEVPQGAYVEEVSPRSPAFEAGIKSGDIIIKMNGQNIDSESKLGEIISQRVIGSKVEIIVLRDRREVKLTATIANSPVQ